jgi:hypothetical protein
VSLSFTSLLTGCCKRQGRGTHIMDYDDVDVDGNQAMRLMKIMIVMK